MRRGASFGSEGARLAPIFFFARRTPHRDSAWQVTPPTPAHVPPTARVDTPGTAHFPAGSPPQYTPGTQAGTPAAMYGTPAETPGMYSPTGAGLRP